MTNPKISRWIATSLFFLAVITLPNVIFFACSSNKNTSITSIEQTDDTILLRSTNKPYSGIARSTYTSGQYRVECKIHKGRITEWKRWYPNGVREYHAIVQEARLRDTSLSYRPLLEHNTSKFSGNFEAFHPNNQTAVKVSFRDGNPEGIARSWHPNGILRSEIDFTESPHPKVKLFDRQGILAAELIMGNPHASDLFLGPIPSPGTPLAARMREFRLYHENGYVHVHGRYSRFGRSLSSIETWDTKGNRIRRPQPEDEQATFRLGDHTLAMNWVRPGELIRSAISPHASQEPLKIEEGFWLGIHEVTQDQWNAVMDKNPSFFDNNGRLPAETMTWHEANEFCRRLTRMQSDLGKLPIGYEFSLPTHPQWEYTFRAGDTGLIPHTFLEMIPHTENTPARTLPVASAKPNAWGFYDMMSNVSEWGKKEHTLSWRHRPPMAQTWSMDLYRTGVVMGGSTAHKPNRCNYLRMYSESSNARFRTIGFRVALVRTPSSHLFSDASNN